MVEGTELDGAQKEECETSSLWEAAKGTNVPGLSQEKPVKSQE